MKEIMKRFLIDEQGTETVEWVIMIGIIALAAISVLVLIAGHVTTIFQKLETALGTAAQ